MTLRRGRRWMEACVVGPIERGARGPAVEDVQRRLLGLGYDLGPTGIDGVFLGKTLDAVSAFQRAKGLDEDGVVGDATWSALVDATFILGDRVLYLRLPYFHGVDVRVLQGALNALGFACGEPDGIFGAFTERAVREFQVNVAQPADGIAGAETMRAVLRLRHVWQDKDPSAPVALTAAPARAADVLARVPVAVHGLDDVGRQVAERIANVALATSGRARVRVAETLGEPGVLVHLGVDVDDDRLPSVPRVGFDAGPTLEPRLLTALSALDDRREVVLDIDSGLLGGPSPLQRLAVRALDALCVALSDDTGV